MTKVYYRVCHIDLCHYKYNFALFIINIHVVYMFSLKQYSFVLEWIELFLRFANIGLADLCFSIMKICHKLNILLQNICVETLKTYNYYIA